MSAISQSVKAAKVARGRRWAREAERCETCRHWTDRKSEFDGWRLCEVHKKWLHASGGCAQHAETPKS